MRAEVMVCVKKSKGKLVNASDSWHAKVNKITKAVQIFTSVDLRNLNPPTVHLTIYHLVWKTSLPFKHSFWNGSSSVEHLCGETLQLVNSKVQHVHSANDLQTTLIAIVGSLAAAVLFLNCFKSTLRNPVHLVWVVLSINIKHNHVLAQQFTGPKSPDRAKLCDSCLSRKEGHVSFQPYYEIIVDNTQE